MLKNLRGVDGTGLRERLGLREMLGEQVASSGVGQFPTLPPPSAGGGRFGAAAVPNLGDEVLVPSLRRSRDGVSEGEPSGVLPSQGVPEPADDARTEPEDACLTTG
eukprot:scaffold126537_cov30-Tisochrysis_lutea.AAC.4